MTFIANFLPCKLKVIFLVTSNAVEFHERSARNQVENLDQPSQEWRKLDWKLENTFRLDLKCSIQNEEWKLVEQRVAHL